VADPRLRRMRRHGDGQEDAVRSIAAVEELSERYDAVLCDVWGVLHDGRTVFPAAAEGLISLRAAGVCVVLLTNMPRPSSTMPGALGRLGFPDDAWDAIVTSGDAIRGELARRAPGPVLRLGRESDPGLWDGLGLRFVEDPDGAGFMAIAGLRGIHESPRDYAGALRAGRDRDLELLCANPDRQIRTGSHLRWCAGAVADDYEAIGGRVVQAGKPHAAIYARAFEVLDGIAGRSIPRERVLAVGDVPATDLLGANRQGLDSLFIATGIHGTTLLDGEVVHAARVRKVLAGSGVSATYVMPRLR
jgi:HAD superfamily hydrolase (TIGR01459 family)